MNFKKIRVKRLLCLLTLLFAAAWIMTCNVAKAVAATKPAAVKLQSVAKKRRELSEHSKAVSADVSEASDERVENDASGEQH